MQLLKLLPTKAHLMATRDGISYAQRKTTFSDSCVNRAQFVVSLLFIQINSPPSPRIRRSVIFATSFLFRAFEREEKVTRFCINFALKKPSFRIPLGDDGSRWAKHFLWKLLECDIENLARFYVSKRWPNEGRGDRGWEKKVFRRDHQDSTSSSRR